MKKIPKLRFPEFTGEWEEKKLKEIYEFKYGQFNNNPDNGGVYPVYGANGIIGGYNEYNSEKAIVIGHMGAYAGKVLWEERKHFVTYNGTIGKTKNDKILNSKFGYYMLLNKNIQKICAGSGQPFLSYDDLNNVKVICSGNVLEQEKIASFFSNMDEMIVILEEEKELWEKYKKGMMQKIFSQKLRFKDENGNDYPEWEEKKLGDISSNIMYGMNAAATEFDGQNKYIRITDISEASNKFIPNPLSSPLASLEERFLVNENDILFARTGASTGKSYLYDSKDGILYYAGFLIRFNINKENNSKYIFYQTLTKKYQNWLKIMSMRSGQPGINAEEYKGFEMDLPSLPEQEKIANFLSSIDEKIELIEKELEGVKEFKKGLLQQMFV